MATALPVSAAAAGYAQPVVASAVMMPPGQPMAVSVAQPMTATPYGYGGQPMSAVAPWAGPQPMTAAAPPYGGQTMPMAMAQPVGGLQQAAYPSQAGYPQPTHTVATQAPQTQAMDRNRIGELESGCYGMYQPCALHSCYCAKMNFSADKSTISFGPCCCWNIFCCPCAVDSYHQVAPGSATYQNKAKDVTITFDSPRTFIHLGPMDDKSNPTKMEKLKDGACC